VADCSGFGSDRAAERGAGGRHQLIVLLRLCRRPLRSPLPCGAMVRRGPCRYPMQREER
jgi:hypothetical protein